MSKTKVAYLAPEFIPTWGGVGIYSVNLVKELSKDKKLEIHVITPKRGKDYDKDKIIKQFGKRIHLHNLSTATDTFFYNFKFQVALFRQFRELHGKYKFDIIHAANLVHMPDIWLKFTRLKIPSVVTVHTTIKGQVSGFLRSNKNFFRMAPSEKASLILYPGIALLEKIYLKKTNHVISISHKFSKKIKEEYGYQKDLVMIHNGIDLSVYNEKVKEYELDVPKGKKIILYVGRLITQKGIQLFLRLAHEIDAHFVIAGSGKKEFLHDLLRQHKVPKEKVTFLGFVENEELPGLYKKADVFVLPSFYENFPISLMEAMAMRCPCVASDVGAVDEIIEHRKSGYIFRAGDYNALKEYVLEALKGKKSDIIDTAYNKIKNELNTKQVARQTAEYYEQIR